MSQAGFSPARANGLAFAVATLCSYVVNTKWSFAKKLQRHNFFRFIVVALFGLGTTMAVAKAAQAAGLSDYLGIVVVVVVMPPIMFLLHNFWTYR